MGSPSEMDGLMADERSAQLMTERGEILSFILQTLSGERRLNR